MDKAFSNFTWKNTPSLETPLNQQNLNKINNGLNTVDDRVVAMDTSKANVADLLTDVVNVAYNNSTGVWTFTRRNGTTFTYDQNIEKIPVSFSMSPAGVITMTTADGTSYTADIATRIKIYTFVDSTTIDFTTTTDGNGNKTITANIIDGSITDAKLQPNYLADITVQAQSASASADDALLSANNANTDALLAQSYAVGGTGIRQGEDTDNAKYYKEQAAAYGTPRHIIQDNAGVDANARLNLMFENGVVTDDATNNKTKVKIGIDDTEWAQIQAILGTAT